jgi:hypothetical protein
MVDVGCRLEPSFLDHFEQACIATAFEGFNAKDLYQVMRALAKCGRRPGVVFMLGYEQAALVIAFEGFSYKQLTWLLSDFRALEYMPTAAFIEGFDAACEIARESGDDSATPYLRSRPFRKLLNQFNYRL